MQIYPINRNWIGATVFGVTIDDCPALRYLCQQAREWRSMSNLDDRIAAAKEQVLAALSRNAVALAQESSINSAEREYYHAFVYKPTDAQKQLSYALIRRVACCRYYHSLLFILLKECGIIATACGKIPPNGTGYTWVLAFDNRGGPVIIDLFRESLVRAGLTELDYEDPTGKYQDTGYAWAFAE